MSKILPITFLILTGICFFNLPVLAQNDKTEKIRSVKTVIGKFVRFEVGDYVHADIKRSHGKIISFWLKGPGLDYFLALNQGKTMTFTYEVVTTYIPENGGPMTIERIKSAKVGSLTSEKWWKDLRKKYSVAQIDKKYGPLVNKYTK